MVREGGRQVALNLVLGATGAGRIERLRQRLRDAGLTASDVAPHLTIAVVEDGDPAALAKVFSEPPPAAVQVVSFGVFVGPPGVVFAGVAPTLDLVRLHDQTWAAVGELGDGWPRYQPGCWVPHCTLAMPLEPEDLAAAVTALAGTELPFPVDVAELAVADLETGETLFSTPS